MKLLNRSDEFLSVGLVTTTPCTCVTYSSLISTAGTTARKVSYYVDEVPVGLWVVLPETYGRLIVVLFNSQPDPSSLISSYKETDQCQFMTECDAPADSESATL